METLTYATKVIESTLQTVSSKVGPIIDFLIDLAVGMNVDTEQAIRLWSKEIREGSLGMI